MRRGRSRGHAGAAAKRQDDSNHARDVSGVTNPELLVVGAAHVLDLSVPLRATLEGQALEGIAVELDAERAATLLASAPGKGTPRHRIPLLLRLWAMLQKRLGEQLGIGVGAEMRVAAQLAREWHIPLFLIDDPVRQTVGRLLASLSMRERVQLVIGGLFGLFIPAGVVEGQIEEYSRASEEYLLEVRRLYPTVARVLLDERNEHMADRLAAIRAQGVGRVAAVVGDAHVGGLSDALNRRGIPTRRVSLAQLTRATVR